MNVVIKLKCFYEVKFYDFIGFFGNLFIVSIEKFYYFIFMVKIMVKRFFDFLCNKIVFNILI